MAADNVTATYGRNPGEAAGTYTISATLSPVAVLSNYNIKYNTAVFTINKATTGTTISGFGPNPSVVGQAVAVTFSVTPQFNGTPTGSVTVTASTGESCTGTLTGGAGTCSLTFVSSGTRTMKATYSGDGNFLSSTSPVSGAQNVLDFVIGVSPGSQTANGNQKVPYTLTLTAIGGVPMPISLSCSVPVGSYT